MLFSHPGEQGRWVTCENTSETPAFMKKGEFYLTCQWKSLLYTRSIYLVSTCIGMAQHIVLSTEHRWSPGGGQRGSLAGQVVCTLGAACAAPALWLQQQTYPVRRNLISSESRFSIWFVPRTCKKHSRLHAALTTDIHMHLNHLGFTFLRHIGELHSFGVCN